MERIVSNDFTDEEMIYSLQEFYNEHGIRPRMKDFKGKIPSDSMIAKRFGSWSNAIEKAGIPKGKLRETDYNKEYLLNCLFKYYSETDKIPTIRGLKSKGYPTAHAFINHFGSFKNALIESGLYELRKDKHQFCDTYTDDEMLDNLKNYMKDKERIPVHSIIKDELRNPSISAYERRFYSVFNALKLIDYDYEKQKEQDLIGLENEMIEKYKQLKETLNRVPSSRDIEYYSRKYKTINSMSSYEFHFGSLYELQVICGFTPTVIGRNKSRQDLLNDLVKMSEELERTPSQNDLKYFDDVASSSTYRKEFGSWNEAVSLSGLKPNSEVYYSNNGVECLSYYELLFTNMLEENKIYFLKEERYRKYINTNRLYRFDYVIELSNQQYFIEIFGITCNQTYKERTRDKIRLCKENQLNLIEIYPNDFTSYKLEDIHKMFKEKFDLFEIN
ncbi:homing endonuclease associated repeat-containing protein [Bacillus xiapuensis]|uniref:DUF559 domain-containing protein n=1 Tax=Bacillus xiapuensis TaxID=2014075 RepID=A0ABU6N8N1_9BACI|nr:hypothetical protein [Bacillus xiapuensis]